MSSFGGKKMYVVQTAEKVIQRCILMATDPGDLVFDPTCGSGTTALVAEQWGRRWITVDVSRGSVGIGSRKSAHRHLSLLSTPRRETRPRRRFCLRT